MLKNKLQVAAVLALCAVSAIAQADDGEVRIRKALEGRTMLVKMDLPAVDTGIPMVFDDANVTFDENNYKKLLKEYGPGTPKGTKARITGVNVTNRGIEIDLDGGGSPERDWMVGSVKLVPPLPLAKSDRELSLERQLDLETNLIVQNAIRGDIEVERQIRTSQDMRNQEAYQHMTKLRSQYIESNRKNWGTKLIIVVHSRGPNVKMSDMVKSLAKYVELMPRDTPGQ